MTSESLRSQRSEAGRDPSRVLTARRITVNFGGVTANHEVNIDVHAGQVVGIIGPNGAGKTTLIDALTGFVPTSGRIELVGRDLTRLDATRRARAGLVRTWQSIELFDDLSVADNLAVAAQSVGRRSDVLRHLAAFDTSPPRERIEAALAAVGVVELASAFPGELSHGQRKLVGVARALVAEPTVLCLDEPAAGLSEDESRDLGRLLRHLGAGGTSMLLVDHDMTLVLGVCDHVYVMEAGRVTAEGPPETVRTDPRVLDAYLGRRDHGGHEPGRAGYDQHRRGLPADPSTDETEAVR